MSEWGRAGEPAGDAETARAVAAEVALQLPGAELIRVLKHDRYATTAQIRLTDGTLAVWKRSVVVLPPGVRVAPAARRLARREADHLEHLAGVPGVPRLLGRPAPDTFLRAWIDGSTMRELPHVPDGVFPALRSVLAEIHARGVAYADLAKEENVIVGTGGADGAEVTGGADVADGSGGAPWLVDFQVSVARGTWLGALVPLLQRADRVHLARHVQRRRPDQLTDEDRATLARGKGILNRLHRTLVKKPYNLVTRRLVTRWSGAGEGRREGEDRG